MNIYIYIYIAYSASAVLSLCSALLLPRCLWDRLPNDPTSTPHRSHIDPTNTSPSAARSKSSGDGDRSGIVVWGGCEAIAGSPSSRSHNDPAASPVCPPCLNAASCS